MYPRTNYEMTDEELQSLLGACKPTPVMFLSGGVPIGGNPQENANAAWAQLGRKRGFDYTTVRPIEGKGQRFFSAVPSENEIQKQERMAREIKETRLKEIQRLELEIAAMQLTLDQYKAEAKKGGESEESS